MPCHPDRVRRNYEPSADTRHLLFFHVDEARGSFDWLPNARANEVHAARAARDVQVAAAGGITANVIEGDHHDLWGI